MGDTAIPYATKSWNPVHGCSPAGAGCVNCWARRVAETRLRGHGTYPADEPFRVVLAPEKLEEPLRWTMPQRVMVPTMGDLLHASVPDSYILDVLKVVARAEDHRFMLFTKRPDRLLDITRRYRPCVYRWVEEEGRFGYLLSRWPIPNLWLIASASTQAEVDRIAPVLLSIPAALHGLSLEPLLEEVTLPPEAVGGYPESEEWARTGPKAPHLGWCIVGCESGPDRRPMDRAWIPALRAQVTAVGAAFYYKQAMLGNTMVVHPFLGERQWTEIPEVTP